ncbi:hypothetical protein A6S26_03980 [Nostoc sp. ATCC 43529]|nr:hypothetical protein A6S26_03980 [Nostoc sp. ATCC 43529]
MVHPIVLIPGLAGSRLKTHNKTESPEEGVTGGGLWLGADMAPPTGQRSQKVDEQTDVEYPPSNIVGLNAPVYATKAALSTEDPVVTNWKKNLKLKDHNGITPEVEEDQNPQLPKDDPAIQFNRFVDGLDGIANLLVNYELVDVVGSTQPAVKKVNYFYELAAALFNTPQYRGDLDILPKNIIAAPYDWRTGPAGLQQRYQYFSNLKSDIEKLYKPNPLTPGIPVVIIAQSLGNRVTQYFLEWVKNNDLNDGKLWGQAWIDKHIERYIAVSAPWLGAPLAIRLTATDDGFNLGGASLSGIKNVLQSFSSIPWLLPATETQYQYFNTQGQFGFVRKEGVDPGQSVDPSYYTPETIENTLILGGAENTTLKYIEDYEQDPNFSAGEFGSKAITSPPVKNIDVIYSTGFNTPVGAYYYQEEGKLKVASYLGNETENLQPVEDGDFVVINGVRFEKADKTTQLISDDGITNSGDGVVPYGSLAYFKRWTNNPDVPGQKITGYPFVKTEPTEDEAKLGIDLSHNSIIRHPEAIKLIFNLLGISKFNISND